METKKENKQEKRGRPKGRRINPLNLRNKDVHIYFTETEHQKLKELSKYKRQYVNDFCRKIILDLLDSELEFVRYEVLIAQRELIAKKAQLENLMAEQELIDQQKRNGEYDE